MTRKIFIRLGLGLVAVCVVAFFLGLSSWNKVNEPVSSNADSVVFTVASGSSMRSVAKRLEEEKLIRSAKALRLLSRVRGLDGKIRAGEYDLSAASDTSAILTLLTSGTMKTYEISIPEGLTAREISVRLEAAELCDSEAFLAYALDPESAKQLGIEGPSLEGYLFPETYRLPRGLPPERIARIFVDEFNKNWEQVVKGKSSTTLNKQELVTLASIVEKETGAAEERPTIAAVFVNRMKLGMRLETDPTVIYGISDFDGNLTRAHLRDKSNPYNTYKIYGLPPGPIANPGADALRAALQPADSPYLYFVSMNDGRHQFSETYKEHVNAVNRYQRWGRHRKN